MTDDDRPRPRIERLTVLPLDELGLDELRDYADRLAAEIRRVEDAIGRKRGVRDAADAVFGRRPPAA